MEKVVEVVEAAGTAEEEEARGNLLSNPNSQHRSAYALASSGRPTQ